MYVLEVPFNTIKLRDIFGFRTWKWKALPPLYGVVLVSICFFVEACRFRVKKSFFIQLFLTWDLQKVAFFP